MKRAKFRGNISFLGAKLRSCIIFITPVDKSITHIHHSNTIISKIPKSL